ncbi:MAG: HAMP domain-containing sensor histidine kinase [Collinsella sp.]|nr:HAMP domain-containing sensor histidine kinase [Collinsella sp.]
MAAFTAYLAIYLVIATTMSFALINMVDEIFFRSAWYLDAVEIDNGPYVYDDKLGDLVPATSIDLQDGTKVFLGIRSLMEGRATTPPKDDPAEGASATRSVRTYASLDAIRIDKRLTLYDWGSNIVEDAVGSGSGSGDRALSLRVEGPIDPNELASYDAEQRSLRRQIGDIGVSELGEGIEVSNMAYYVQQDIDEYLTATGRAVRIFDGVFPFVAYCVLGLWFFLRFYRERLARPLGELERAAEKIARQDLDFFLPPVEGSELGRLGSAFERMRSSLADAQRDLSRAAFERRRLNAAFAHDLRTPITVIRGTLEMARMRAERGEGTSPATMDSLLEQVSRLESYVVAMSGISSLEDRPLSLERSDDLLVSTRLLTRVGDIVEAIDRDLHLEAKIKIMEPSPISADVPLMEEVVDNILSNACSHARSRIGFTTERADGGMLAVTVDDDGPGFSPEALHRGCEPFYGEDKGAIHLGLGLNIVQVLVRLHGGAVKLGASPWGGARVRVEFNVDGAGANGSGAADAIDAGCRKGVPHER